MNIDWQRVLPVLVSIGIIIAIALLRNTSRTLASIIAVMPINIPLGLWVVASGVENDQQALVEFTRGLLVNIVPTLLFIAAVWWALRQGWMLWPSVMAGYVVWAVALGIVLLLRAALNV